MSPRSVRASLWIPLSLAGLLPYGAPVAGQVVEVKDPRVDAIREALRRRLEPMDVTIEFEKRMEFAPDPTQLDRLSIAGYPREGKLTGMDERQRKAILAWASEGLTVWHRMRVDMARGGAIRLESAIDYVGLRNVPEGEPRSYIYTKRTDGRTWSWDSGSLLLFYPGMVDVTPGQIRLIEDMVTSARREAVRRLDPAARLKVRLLTSRLIAMEQERNRVMAKFSDAQEEWRVDFEEHEDALWIAGVLYTDGQGEYVQETWTNDQVVGNLRFPSAVEYWSGPVEDLKQDERPASNHTVFSLTGLVDQHLNDAFGACFALPERVYGRSGQVRVKYPSISPPQREMLTLTRVER